MDSSKPFSHFLYFIDMAKCRTMQMKMSRVKYTLFFHFVSQTERRKRMFLFVDRRNDKLILVLFLHAGILSGVCGMCNIEYYTIVVYIKQETVQIISKLIFDVKHKMRIECPLLNAIFEFMLQNYYFPAKNFIHFSHCNVWILVLEAKQKRIMIKNNNETTNFTTGTKCSVIQHQCWADSLHDIRLAIFFLFL